MADLLEKLSMLLFSNLVSTCPYMSGNMQDNITIKYANQNKVVIEISGPSYDIAKWKKTMQIEHDNKYDYALSVNKYGGFYTNNSSKHWVNRSIDRICNAIASENGAEVENRCWTTDTLIGLTNKY